MHNYCWNPRINPRTTGMRSSRPKNGAALRGRRMNGRLGYMENIREVASCHKLDHPYTKEETIIVVTK